MVMKMVQEDIPELNGAIINPTIKGGHIIFQANQIEKRKNKAIFELPNNAKAFKPSFSTQVAFSEINFGGGHFGSVKE